MVVQPRPSGYFVGDVVTQRVLLEGDGTPVTLPPPGRVNTWFERRRTTIETDTSGRHWLAVEYQFLNAPKAVTAATLPAWLLTVKASAAAPPITLSIPATSLNIAPLSPPGSPHQVGIRDLRPYRVAPDIVTTPLLHAIAISSSSLALTLAAWLAWVLWRNSRAATHQPFARALRELRAVASDEPRAWQILHRAFDRAAGRVIQTATLPTLFEHAPQLAPARPQIEAFFTQSNQLFFANGTSPPPSGATPNNHSTHLNPVSLCLHLRHIEKRHER
jgi:mxaA protein